MDLSLGYDMYTLLVMDTENHLNPVSKQKTMQKLFLGVKQKYGHIYPPTMHPKDL